MPGTIGTFLVSLIFLKIRKKEEEELCSKLYA